MNFTNSLAFNGINVDITDSTARTSQIFKNVSKITLYERLNLNTLYSF